MVNKVILIGNLGNDPEMKQLESGISVAHISLATNLVYTNSKGEKKEKTEWHQIECWHRLAEVAAKYFKKGMRIYVEGKLHSNRFEDDKGVRYSTVVQASTLKIVSRNNTAVDADENTGSEDK